MEKIGNDNLLYFFNGTLTEKNLLTQREQILSCKSTIPNSEGISSSIPFQSSQFSSVQYRFNPGSAKQKLQQTTFNSLLSSFEENKA